MSGLVSNLSGQEGNHLAVVRVDATEKSGRNKQSGLLVLDEVGHHLYDSGFHLVR
jgi:hypothetical protein